VCLAYVAVVPERELSFHVPPESILSPAAEPPPVPATPRDAATVVLLRDVPGGIEVFLQRRVTAMAFAAGMTVFPGGGVDRRDADVSVGWAGPEPRQWAGWFGCSPELARALVCAAVRETFEESGVLLAGTADAVVDDTTQFAAARAALVSRELSLAEFLAENDLTLRSDLLRPWANWLTPPQEPRRYDTHFFVAALPEGQRADGATTEAQSCGWQSPAEAIADAEAGRSMLMPPTWFVLDEIGRFSSVSEVLAEQKSISKVIPTLVRDGDRVRVQLGGQQ
jgi:8-oxo-dGTP pyrophosphatase MutT (NUDIX family)